MSYTKRVLPCLAFLALLTPARAIPAEDVSHTVRLDSGWGTTIDRLADEDGLRRHFGEVGLDWETRLAGDTWSLLVGAGGSVVLDRASHRRGVCPDTRDGPGKCGFSAMGSAGVRVGLLHRWFGMTLGPRFFFGGLAAGGNPLQWPWEWLRDDGAAVKLTARVRLFPEEYLFIAFETYHEPLFLATPSFRAVLGTKGAGVFHMELGLGVRPTPTGWFDGGFFVTLAAPLTDRMRLRLQAYIGKAFEFCIFDACRYDPTAGSVSASVEFSL